MPSFGSSPNTTTKFAGTSHGTLERLITSASKGAMCGSIPLSARTSIVMPPRGDVWVTLNYYTNVLAGLLRSRDEWMPYAE